MGCKERFEDLGYISIDVDFPTETIGECEGEDYIFINFKKRTIFKWADGFDACFLVGEDERVDKIIEGGEDEED